MEAVDYEKIFKDSKPYNIYKELDDEVKDVTDGQHCTEFEGINSTHKEKYVTLCKKVSKLLKYVFDKDKLKKSKEYCSHYRNWVYQEIWNLFKEGASNNDIEDVINKFNKLQFDLFSHYKRSDCSYRFDIKNLQGLNYKVEEKYLYDYFKNYNTIKTSENCNKCTNDKYKEYLKSISDIYNNWKDSCCWYGKSVCDNYFLSCKDEFDPSEILSAFLSKGNGSCDGLNSITANFDEEELNSMVSDLETLNTITYGTCHYLDNHELTPGEKRRQHCNLLAASVMLTRSAPTAGNDGSRASVSGSSSGSAISESRADQTGGDPSRRPALQGQLDAKGKEGDSDRAEVKQVVSPMKDASDNFRWKIAATGQLKCSSKNKKEAELAMCNFMEELIEGGHAKKIEGTEKYTLDIKNGWTTEKLRVYRERIRKRSIYESNILNNIFVRISTGVTLVMGIIFIFYLFFKFTPFGSRLCRHRKRKQRYRLDFTDLSTRKRPRRFLKRTYRHSDRRRFNVVNVEDELHSSNDLRNIN
ncbi:PIR protein [Plasmodium malariae]|uniref:PIR protein n=1 Tax=Plasmodium malariae TaxID=5858 RepID=A0A1D3JHR7_PLAMA|nr:PIR protein [Plasmodium malariae]SBT85767.1 PIR protein [Plasmodium malariae]